MLRVENVTKTFGKTVVLHNLSFEVKKGDFVFITGPSGSGKTTLVRLILREMLPNKGKIYLDDIDITGLPKKVVPRLRQRIGVVFQDYKVLTERTVKENIEVALAIVGVPSDQWDSRVERVLELTGLGRCANHFPAQLSGGELQRVSLCRALVVNPKIILADEPTGNLDWKTAEEMMDLFERINKEGKTILVATHHKLIVDKMKKRVVELKPYATRKTKESKEEKVEEVKKKVKKDKVEEEETSKKEEGVEKEGRKRKKKEKENSKET